jgi:hypothetical protein
MFDLSDLKEKIPTSVSLLVKQYFYIFLHIHRLGKDDFFIRSNHNYVKTFKNIFSRECKLLRKTRLIFTELDEVKKLVFEIKY